MKKATSHLIAFDIVMNYSFMSIEL